MEKEIEVPVEPGQRYVHPIKDDEAVIEIKGVLNGEVMYQELYPSENKMPEKIYIDTFNQFVKNGYFKIVYPLDQMIKANPGLLE